MNKYRVVFAVLVGIIAIVGRAPNHPSVYQQLSDVLVADDANRSDLKWHLVHLTLTCLTGHCRYI